MVGTNLDQGRFSDILCVPQNLGDYAYDCKVVETLEVAMYLVGIFNDRTASK